MPVKTKQHVFFCKELSIVKKSKIAVLWTAFRGNDFEASFLNGADHTFAGLRPSGVIIAAIRKFDIIANW